MDSGVSPHQFFPSPSFQYMAPYNAALFQPNLNMSTTGHQTGPRPRLQRRRWPGLLDADTEKCSDCPGASGRVVCSGLNTELLPYEYDSQGRAIIIYGKTPADYRREFGQVKYFTWVLSQCINCGKCWYHYLFHRVTDDGRMAGSSAAQGAPIMTSAALQSSGLTYSLSTPGRLPGSDIPASPTATLVDESSAAFVYSLAGETPEKPGPRLENNFGFDGLDPPLAGSAPCYTPTPTSYPSTHPAPLSTLVGASSNPPTVSNTHQSAPRLQTNVNTRVASPMTPSPWTPYSSRAPAGGHHTPSHSGSSWPPLAPDASDTGMAQSISPIRRQPTRPLSPPPKKVQRDNDSYLTMRNMLACDECRRKKKKCDPSHEGARRPWKQRHEQIKSLERKGSWAEVAANGIASSVTSPGQAISLDDLWSPEVAQGDWSPVSRAGVSQSPDPNAMFGPPQG